MKIIPETLYKNRKLAALVVLIWLFPAQQFAQSPASDSLTNTQILERTGSIQNIFDQGESAARWWSFGWISIYSGLTIYSASAAVYLDKEDQGKNFVGAGKSMLALSLLVLQPFHARHSAGDLRSLPEATPSDRREKLQTAETWLERNSRQQQKGTSLLRHTVNFLVQVAGGIITWKVDNSVANGVESMLVGLAVSEACILTQPTSGIDGYRSYRQKYGLVGAKSQPDEVPWFVAAYPGGVVAGMYF